MQYRAIGKTGVSASIIGLGAEYLDEKPYDLVEETLHAAIDNGINIIDVFMPGEEVRKNIGKALAGRRDKVILQGHICSTDTNQQYDISRDLSTVKKYFENLLRFLDTDYIDFGMLFFIDSEHDYQGAFESPILEYALGLKEKGVIRHLGASSHVAATAKKVIETNLVDLLMFSINPAFDLVPPNAAVQSTENGKDAPAPIGKYVMDPERAQLYHLCESRGVGITVMKTLASGKLLSPLHTPFARPLTVGQCIHYALTRPAVASSLVGCESREQVEETVGYLRLTDAERDYAPAIGSIKEDFKGKCVYCRHCLPCPSGIDIARVHRNLDAAVIDEKNIPPKIIRHYKALKHYGSDCVSCGSCETRCPFGVPVIRNMARAAELFGR
ncbi:MAG: aldo/keto reductase [Planctomycetes bacterium]|nr:aldo/keto reductase [Planctomycetota bacterium]